jgi:hypothetical protein
MSLETAVLCALLRLARSRRRAPTTMNDLLDRVVARPRDVRRALAALSRGSLVDVTPEGPRLTLTGLAVAVASASVRAERARVARTVATTPASHRKVA